MKKTQEFILREIADEYILVPTGSTAESFNGVITLTETAVYIYNNIDKVNSFEELIDMMLQEYNVDKIDLINDATVFITQLYSQGFIEPDDKEKGW